MALTLASEEQNYVIASGSAAICFSTWNSGDCRATARNDGSIYDALCFLWQKNNLFFLSKSPLFDQLVKIKNR